MGLIKKVLGTGATKEDVKVAKIELKKAKLEKKTQKEKNLAESAEIREQERKQSVDNYLGFIRLHFNRIEKTILTLKNDAEKMKEQILVKRNSNLSFSEKRKLKELEYECIDSIKYLYLSKDYLMFLTKFASGINLNEEETSLVIKFTRFFDGVKVIEVEEYDEDDDDDSIFGEFKDMAKEIGEVFYKPKSSSSKPKKPKPFYFSEYLDIYHREKVYALEIPDVNYALEIFKTTLGVVSVDNKPQQTEVESNQSYTKCPSCSAEVSIEDKFCHECGEKMEVAKPMFCGQCGKALEIGTKFCPSCGHKVN